MRARMVLSLPVRQDWHITLAAAREWATFAASIIRSAGAFRMLVKYADP
jgi:hypothetical protein